MVMLLSIKNSWKVAWHNQKIELFIVFSGIVSAVILATQTSWDATFCAKVALVFNDSHLNRIISASAIILGIYIAAISIIATSILGITEDMLKKNKDKDLLQITFSGMMVNTMLVFFCVLFDVTETWHGILLIALLAIAFVSFVKFMCLMFLIFQANFNQLSKQISREESEKEDFFTILKGIEQKLSNK